MGRKQKHEQLLVQSVRTCTHLIGINYRAKVI